MAISVQATNKISEHLLAAGVIATAGALIGSVSSLTAPVGAVFGVVNSVISKVAGKTIFYLFNADNPQANKATKVVAVIASLVLTALATTFAMTLSGWPMTIGTALLLPIPLTFVSVLVAIPVALAVGTGSGIGSAAQPNVAVR